MEPNIHEAIRIAIEQEQATQGVTLGWLQFALGVAGLFIGNLLTSALLFAGLIKFIYVNDRKVIHNRINDLKADQQACKKNHKESQNQIMEFIGRSTESNDQSCKAILEVLDVIKAEQKDNYCEFKVAMEKQEGRTQGVSEVLSDIREYGIAIKSKK